MGDGKGDKRREMGDRRWGLGDGRWRGFSDIIFKTVIAYNLAGEVVKF